MDSGGAFLKALVDRGVSIGPISVGAKQQTEDRLDSNPTAESVFSEAAPLLKTIHVVVMVDEAQDTPTNTATRGVVRCLHDPPKQIPLVAAFFGLSDTKHVLRKCGLSRPPRGRLINLERLSLEDAAASIRSVFDAYGFTGKPEDIATWVERLAEQSQGWPQHVNSVSIAAGSVIRDNGGKVTAERLIEATELAENYKDEYYKGRLDAGSSKTWVYKQLALTMEERGGSLEEHEIGRLTEFARKEKSQTLDNFLINALHAGLLSPDPDPKIHDHYRIPIPSLGDYLRAMKVTTPSEFQN